MKHLIAILFLIPTLAFGAFTEFYCQSGGSNINSGSTTSNTAAYTATNGNWSTVTNIYIPTDGSTPASSVNVGDWASVYADGATAAVYIARVTTVAAGVNGSITLSSTAKAGTAPGTSATARSIKVGGAWKGPTGAVFVPFSLSSFGAATDASLNRPRINMKNDASYLPTAAISSTGVASTTVQGYSSSPGDGGKAIIDWSTNTPGITISSVNAVFADIIFTGSITTGTSQLVDVSGGGDLIIRCVAHGARNNGFNSSTGGNVFIECESYDNNKANTANKGGFSTTQAAQYVFCISHDNAGSNSSGFLHGGSSSDTIVGYNNCIADTNGSHGFKSGVNSPPLGNINVFNCDFYNNGGDGINMVGGTNTSTQVVIIRNSNFIKNTGSGINIAAGSGGNTLSGFLDNNGYGAGTQANGSADVVSSCIVAGSVTYPSNTAPWVDPANGDFRINAAAANWAGRGAFTQTAASYAGTVGFPDIGAAQSKTGAGGTFSKEVSYGYAY